MGDQQGADLAALADAVDALGDHPQRVDVEAGVGLVEDRDLRLEKLQLKDLVPLLLTAGEALVDVALGEGRVDAEALHGLLDLLDPGTQLGRLAAQRGGGGAQEVGDGDAGHLDRILHGEEDAGACPLVHGHLQDVLAVEAHRAAGDRVLGVAGEGVGEGGLAGAVGPHDRVRLALLHCQVDAAQDLGGAVRSASTETCRSLISSVAMGTSGLLGDGDEHSRQGRRLRFLRGTRAWVASREDRTACRCAGRSWSRAASTRSGSRRPRPRTGRRSRASRCR